MYVEVEGTQDLIDCAKHLAKTEKGRSAITHILAWLDSDGLSLDQVNKEAALTLLMGAFDRYPGTARDVMRDALAQAQCSHNWLGGYCDLCGAIKGE